MKRSEKHTLVQELNKELAGVRHAILVDFRGLKVSQVDDLRRKVRESHSAYRVVKNTLAKRALAGTPLAPLAEHFEGVTGIAWNTENPVTLAKVLTDFAKANEALKFKAAVLDGSPVAAEGIKSVASMPTREELLARLAYLLQSPMQRLVVVLQAPSRNVAVALQEVARKQEKAATA